MENPYCSCKLTHPDGPQLTVLAAAAAGASAAPVLAGGAVAIAAVSGVAVLAGGGSQPAHWVPDGERTACVGCTAVFGTVTRKHHCRGCGEVFCDSCAPPRPQSGERACKTCDAAAAPQLGALPDAAPVIQLAPIPVEGEAEEETVSPEMNGAIDFLLHPDVQVIYPVLMPSPVTVSTRQLCRSCRLHRR